MADRLTPRPQFESQSRPQPYEVTARPVDIGGNIRRAPNADLMGLVEGLQSFNPALNRFRQVAEANAETDGKQKGQALAQQVDPGALPLDLQPTPDTGLIGTADSIARSEFRKGITLRTAEKIKADALAKYQEEKDLPGFNVESFLGGLRRDSLAGLQDDMAGPMGAALVPFEAAVRQDFERVRLGRLNESREANISAALREGITGTDGESIADTYRTQLLPIIKGQGKTAAEGAQYLLGHLTALSEKQGGSPALFDALLTDKDETGKTIADYNPSLVPRILAAKEHAKALVDRQLEQDSQAGNARTLKALDERVAQDPNKVTFEDVLANLGPHAPFKTDNEVMGYWRHVLSQRASAAGQDNLLQLATGGQLFMADEKDQKATMGSLTGGVLAGLSKAIESKDTSGIAALTDALVSAHNKAGSTVPSGPIERMFKFIGQSVPSGTEPPPVFQAAAEVYRRLASAPQLRAAYFDEKSSKVLEAYVSSAASGTEPSAAYKDAYTTISPEAERRAEAFKQTPEYREKTSKVLKEITGSSWWPRMLGGNGRPENAGQLVAEAQQWSLDYLKRNPQATDEQVAAAREQWAAKSFVLDSTTGTAIKVPSGVSPELAQKAVSDYTSKLSKELRLGDRESGWGLTMIPSNINQGTYRVATSFNGAPVHLVGEVAIGKLIQDHRVSTMFLPEDAKVLRDADTAGATSPALPAAIAKARQLGVMPDVVKRLEAREVQSAMDALKALPRPGGMPDSSVLFKNDRPMKADPKLTVASAQRLLDTAGGGSTGLAASLVTMGEAVMLQAYDDPARGAGKNIGMGYNLKANEATAARDLKAAGVPSDLIQGVIDGAAKLSPEQAERLTLVAVGRYERTAEGQVNSFQPNLWAKLQPQQRAVLTDIAYQTGNVGQFKKALTALFNGNQAEFQNESKVFYTNREGERVEDVRRNELRNAMLSGTSFWQSVLVKQGSRPGLLDTIVATSK